MNVAHAARRRSSISLSCRLTRPPGQAGQPAGRPAERRADRPSAAPPPPWRRAGRTDTRPRRRPRLPAGRSRCNPTARRNRGPARSIPAVVAGVVEHPRIPALVERAVAEALERLRQSAFGQSVALLGRHLVLLGHAAGLLARAARLLASATRLLGRAARLLGAAARSLARSARLLPRGACPPRPAGAGAPRPTAAGAGATRARPAAATRHAATPATHPTASTATHAAAPATATTAAAGLCLGNSHQADAHKESVPLFWITSHVLSTMVELPVSAAGIFDLFGRFTCTDEGCDRARSSQLRHPRKKGEGPGQSSNPSSFCRNRLRIRALATYIVPAAMPSSAATSTAGRPATTYSQHAIGVLQRRVQS